MGRGYRKVWPWTSGSYEPIPSLGLVLLLSPFFLGVGLLLSRSRRMNSRPIELTGVSGDRQSQDTL